MDTRIGKQLTQAREALGLIVEDVAHRTRIPAAVVRQLESEDFSQFPNNVYAKSFLRLYSRHLGIDPATFIAEHDGRLQKREDEVAFLDGIALSPEFRPEEAIAASPVAVAAVEASRSHVEPGKISSKFMTGLLLLVVGVPLAIWLSKLYGGDDSVDPPAGEVANSTASEGSPAPEEEVETPEVSADAPVVEDAAPPAASLAAGGFPEDPAPEIESTTLNPPLDVPKALPVMEGEGDEEEQPPRAAAYEEPPAADLDTSIANEPVASAAEPE